MLAEHKLFKWVNIFVLYRYVFHDTKNGSIDLCIDRWTLMNDASHTYAIKNSAYHVSDQSSSDYIIKIRSDDKWLSNDSVKKKLKQDFV